MKKENSPMTWQPKADLDTLRLRAAMYEKIREFFKQRQVMEVDTPILSVATTPDPNIDSFETNYFPVTGKASPERRYLSTSPEFPMKRLLASGSGSIYQLCHVFRQAEQGRQHNPEFTMLEWYRVEMGYQALMEEVAELVSALTQQSIETELVSYQSAFLQHLNLDPLSASVAESRKLAEQYGLVSHQQNDEDKDFYLDFLMSHQVQPSLGAGKLTFVHEYPASQCAFAKLSSQNPLVAERFELFYRGVELANGYQELTDAEEQQRRFERQNKHRTQQGKPVISVDSNLLEALEQGMPQCSGVALGVDRLIQLTQDMKNIEDVLAFPFNRA